MPEFEMQTLDRPLLGGDSSEEGGLGPEANHGEANSARDDQKLGTLLGVVVPVIMSLFGVVLYLRLGWCVGQAGVAGSLAILALATVVSCLTVLSLSALSTNGAVGAGGLYFVISRSLGSEFGGSIGVIFYSANIAGCALYMTGFAETMMTTLGLDFGGAYKTQLVLSSSTLLLLVAVALAGAKWFAKVTTIIFVPLLLSILAGFVSLMAVSPGKVEGFTGLSAQTLRDNMGFGFEEYEGRTYDLRTVFGVFFPAATGIMAGANMSGDLRNPARSIPLGTLSAFFGCIVIYAMLLLMMGASIERDTLRTNLLVFQDVTFWSPIVTVGICASTLSSALSSIVGGSRILQALGKDAMFPGASAFARGSGAGDEPRRAVILTYMLTQGLLMIGDLNVLAGIVTMFFLMSYGVVNLAVFILRISGAVNFRPLFRYFTWHTSLLGTVMCVVTMFVTDPVVATISVAVLVVVFVGVHFTAPSNTWGSISQALMYHQIRKYLLRLDAQKDHVKYWRPQLLLLVDDARDALNLIDFANDLKKGGLFVLGHVVVGDIGETHERAAATREGLASIVRAGGMKAFPEVAVGPTFRYGAHALVTHSGIGAMRPNTVVMGFFRVLGDPLDDGGVGLYDTPTKKDLGPAAGLGGAGPAPKSFYSPFGDVDGIEHFDKLTDTPPLSIVEYYATLGDALRMGKNVVVARSFARLDKSVVLGFHHYQRSRGKFGGGGTSTASSAGAVVNGGGSPVQSFTPLADAAGATPPPAASCITIDAWLTRPRDSLRPTPMLILQLAFIVSNTDVWRKHSSIRVMALCGRGEGPQVADHVKGVLHKLRIRNAAVVPVEVDGYGDENRTHGSATRGGGNHDASRAEEKKGNGNKTPGNAQPATLAQQTDLSAEEDLNAVIAANSTRTGVVFLPLPELPTDNAGDATAYQSSVVEHAARIERLSRNLPPTMFVGAGGSGVVNLE